MIWKAIWRFTEKKTWRAWSLMLTVAVVAFGGWALFLGIEALNVHTHERPVRSPFMPDEAAPSSTISIPVRFLPNLKLEKTDGGTPRMLNDYGRTVIEAPAGEVALVMVDVWNYNDPSSEEELTGMAKKLKKILEKCRAHGVTVIHAPSHPVVDKYPQYHALKAEAEL